MMGAVRVLVLTGLILALKVEVIAAFRFPSMIHSTSTKALFASSSSGDSDDAWARLLNDIGEVQVSSYAPLTSATASRATGSATLSKAAITPQLPLPEVPPAVETTATAKTVSSYIPLEAAKEEGASPALKQVSDAITAAQDTVVQSIQSTSDMLQQPPPTDSTYPLQQVSDAISAAKDTTHQQVSAFIAAARQTVTAADVPIKAATATAQITEASSSTLSSGSSAGSNAKSMLSTMFPGHITFQTKTVTDQKVPTLFQYIQSGEANKATANTLSDIQQKISIMKTNAQQLTSTIQSAFLQFQSKSDELLQSVSTTVHTPLLQQSWTTVAFAAAASSLAYGITQQRQAQRIAEQMDEELKVAQQKANAAADAATVALAQVRKVKEQALLMTSSASSSSVAATSPTSSLELTRTKQFQVENELMKSDLQKLEREVTRLQVQLSKVLEEKLLLEQDVSVSKRASTISAATDEDEMPQEEEDEEDDDDDAANFNANFLATLQKMDETNMQTKVLLETQINEEVAVIPETATIAVEEPAKEKEMLNQQEVEDIEDDAEEDEEEEGFNNDKFLAALKQMDEGKINAEMEIAPPVEKGEVEKISLAKKSSSKDAPVKKRSIRGKQIAGARKKKTTPVENEELTDASIQQMEDAKINAEKETAPHVETKEAKDISLEQESSSQTNEGKFNTETEITSPVEREEVKEISLEKESSSKDTPVKKRSIREKQTVGTRKKKTTLVEKEELTDTSMTNDSSGDIQNQQEEISVAISKPTSSATAKTSAKKKKTAAKSNKMKSKQADESEQADIPAAQFVPLEDSMSLDGKPHPWAAITESALRRKSVSELTSFLSERGVTVVDVTGKPLSKKEMLIKIRSML